MGGRLGAWVAAALAALNITVNSVTAPLTDLSEYLSDPFGVTYTYTEQGLDSYYSNQVIKISDGVTIIDGMPYYDVWLSRDAAEKFRVNAFDFQTAYSLTSNNNGTFASGSGFYAGIPMFTVSNVNRTQSFTIPWDIGTYQVGDVTFTVSSGSSGRHICVMTTAKGSKTLFNEIQSTWPISGYFSSTPGSSNSYINKIYYDTPIVTHAERALDSCSDYISGNSFDFDYISGTIPVDQVLDEDDGLLIHVPAEDSQGNDTPVVQWVQDHPDSVGTDWHIDAPDADIDLDSLIDDVIIPLIPIIKAEFAEAPVTPAPVDPTTIAGTPWITLDNRLSTIIQSLNPLPIIQTGIGTISTQLGNLINNIQTGFSDVTSGIQSLGDAILQDIELGPIRVFDKALDLLKSLFASILALVKNALGIWHYVVEWLAAIAAPFTFFMGFYSAMGNVFMLPIYAVVAGTIVIAVYRRFGR